jgi:hypothetical protein
VTPCRYAPSPLPRVRSSSNPRSALRG